MKKILITPLDWGLGHATRCIPIIHELLKRGCTVLIAGSGDSLLLLRNEFPHLTFFTLSSYSPVYSRTQNMIWKMMRQIPKFVYVIRNEHQQIETLIEKHKIDFIISDNRYGCWSSKIPSVFITHQLNILMPNGLKWIEPLVALLNKRLIRKFSACWIPDYLERRMSLSGKLSEHDTADFSHVTHIGPLSRFRLINNREFKYDLVCIFSGPEPQRSIFEEKVVEQLRSSSLRYFVVRGVYSPAISARENEAAFLNSEGLQTVISQSPLVITRSGYSTIMDLAVLGKKGILVPTPGQTEQEYLADRWKQKGVFYSVPQHNFNLHAVLEESKSYTGFTVDRSRSDELLSRALDELLRVNSSYVRSMSS
jgi:uncharacterized protein (TIGR00661 family)